MTNFFADHITVEGQEVPATYGKSPMTDAITVFLTLPNGNKTKLRLVAGDEQYQEANEAWHESLKLDSVPDLFALMNEPITPPTYDPAKAAVDMIPAPRPAPSAHKEPKTPTIRGIGFRIVFNQELERTQIIFTKFPSQAARDLVKAAGFYWSPNNQAWQKKLSKKAQRAAEEVAAQLAALKIA